MDLVFSIVYQISLLLALSMIYSLIQRKWDIINIFTKIITGIGIGIIGVGIMYKPYVLLPGLVFDVRSILICMSGFAMGLIPTAIAAAITVVFRIFQGGIGTTTGVSVIVCSALMGLLWRRLYLNKMIENKSSRVFKLYILGVLIHIIMLGCMLFLPLKTAIYTLRYITAPVMILYPAGTLLMGLLIFNFIDNTNVCNQLIESEERYRNIFNNNHTVMLIIDPKTLDIVDANPAAAGFYGWSVEELKTKNVDEIDILSRDEIFEEIDRVVREKKKRFILKHRLSSGEIRDVNVLNALVTIQGKVVLFTIVQDITSRIMAEKKLKESEERLRVTLLSVGDGVIATDREGNITLLNQTAKDITGWSDNMLGKHIDSVFNIVNEYSGEKVENPVKIVIETGNIIGLDNHTVLILADDIRKPIADSAAPIKDDEGNIIGVVLIIRDVTEERNNRNEIEYLGYHDSLTGLYNRRFFDEELIRLDTNRNLPISIIIGDVNSLKLTNDAFGHAVGDKLLIDMANIIKNACRSDDIVARWGGDEFIVLLPKADEKTAENICARINKACANMQKSEFIFSISLGYETKNKANIPMSNIIKHAEDYMYRNKSNSSTGMRNSNIDAILLALHEKSPREREHSNRVGDYCMAIGQAMNLPEKDMNELALAGLMHDIGKIAISDAILNKDGYLTAEEWVEMKRHPEIGYRILSASNNMAYIAEYVLKHHERPDGSGYPKGADKSEIPVQSRILAIADAYDAMTSARPYKAPLSESVAVQELLDCCGTQFDNELVDIFIKKVLKITIG